MLSKLTKLQISLKVRRALVILKIFTFIKLFGVRIAFNGILIKDLLKIFRYSKMEGRRKVSFLIGVLIIVCLW